MGRFKKVLLLVVLSTFALCLAGCAKGNESQGGSSGSSIPQQSTGNGQSGGTSSDGSGTSGSSPDWSPWVPID